MQSMKPTTNEGEGHTDEEIERLGKIDRVTVAEKTEGGAVPVICHYNKSKQLPGKANKGDTAAEKGRFKSKYCRTKFPKISGGLTWAAVVEGAAVPATVAVGDFVKARYPYRSFAPHIS
jgi:hypothetical protein